MDTITDDSQLSFILIGIGLFLAVITVYALVSRSRRIRRGQEDRWLLDFIHFYRNMGFFSYYYDLADRELVNILKLLYADEYRRQIRLKHASTDLDMLVLDEVRVWTDDLEADVGPGEQVYVSTLYRWAEISQGEFHPTEIIETWDGEEGPITIEFTLHGVRHTITPKYLEDWMDIETLIDSVNALITDTGRQFVWHSDGQAAVVLLLTQEERERMERERGVQLWSK
ncbi:hypothetical protein [Brevibacillus dissolubilis]|uniref:hypothetical protein n=1 Tax=Brevibacillus dissolubilis TaxID=1844116 RepID=UPI001116CE86|nr:hypothetical protein [Brevibacillus dissolubilis]